MGTLSIISKDVKTQINLGYDISLSIISCNKFASSPDSLYINNAESWLTTTNLYKDTAGTLIAESGFYSDGINWRYWNKVTNTFTSGDIC